MGQQSTLYVSALVLWGRSIENANNYPKKYFVNCKFKIIWYIPNKLKLQQ